MKRPPPRGVAGHWEYITDPLVTLNEHAIGERVKVIRAPIVTTPAGISRNAIRCARVEGQWYCQRRFGPGTGETTHRLRCQQSTAVGPNGNFGSVIGPNMRNGHVGVGRETVSECVGSGTIKTGNNVSKNVIRRDATPNRAD